MIKEYKETFIDMWNVCLRPQSTLKKLANKPLSLKPLIILIISLFICTSLSTFYLHYQANRMIASSQDIMYYESIKTIAETNMMQYCLTLFFAPLISILSVAIIMFIISTLAHTEMTFKQNLVLVSYSWMPMLLASLLTTLLTFVLPITTTIIAQSFYDYIVPQSFHQQTWYFMLMRIDPFYMWTLFILATGCRVYYGKGGKIWYLIIFALMALPAFIDLL